MAMRLSGGITTPPRSTPEPVGAGGGTGGRAVSILSRLTISRAGSRRSSSRRTSRNNACSSPNRPAHLLTAPHEKDEGEGVGEQEGGLGVKNLLQWAVGVVQKIRHPWLDSPPLTC